MVTPCCNLGISECHLENVLQREMESSSSKWLCVVPLGLFLRKDQKMVIFNFLYQIFPALEQYKGGAQLKGNPESSSCVVCNEEQEKITLPFFYNNEGNVIEEENWSTEQQSSQTAHC